MGEGAITADRGSYDGDVLVSAGEVDALAQFWAAQSPKLCEVAAILAGMRFRGGASDTNLFKNSIGPYAQLVSTMDASAQEGCAITGLIGDTLGIARLVYRHLQDDALAATRQYRQRIDALERLP
jgi:hypothetical protein